MLADNFSTAEIQAGMQFHTADDHFKAVGQCIAAAALPTIWGPLDGELMPELTTRTLTFTLVRD